MIKKRVKSTSRFRLRNRSRYERRLDSEAPLACAYARAFEAAEVDEQLGRQGGGWPEIVSDIASHWIAVLRLAGPPCYLLILQQRIFNRLPFPVLLEQIIERLDGQGVDGGIPLNCQHPKRIWTPAVGLTGSTTERRNETCRAFRSLHSTSSRRRP